MLGSVNVKALRESPHWHGTMGAARGGHELAAMQGVLDLLAGIDVAAISVQSRGKGQPDVLLLLGGRFESGTLQRAFAQQLKTATTLQISPSLLLVGERDPVKAAAKRIAEPRAFPSGLQARARLLAAEHDLMICGVPKAATASAADGIKEFIAGVSFGSTAVSTVEIETQTPAVADKLVAEYTKVIAQAAAAAPPTAQAFRALAAAAKLDRTSQTHLRFRVQATPADVQALQALAPMFGSGVAQRLGQEAGDSAPRARAPEGKIVINGMDGGPREIPMK
jgi:hypothetical protein